MASIRRRRRRREAGFTLIEIMFVVAIIAILAALAIPAFTENSNRTKAKADVVAFFAELQNRQEQYKVDNSVYFPTTPGTTTACPAGTLGSSQLTLDCTAAGKPWFGLNVKPPTTASYCTYTITSGNTAVTNPTVGGVAWVFVGVATTSWYHILAQCDLDGNGTKVSYFTSSYSSDIQVNNEGE